MSSRGVPEVLMVKVDEYVDSLAPQIQPRIASELEVFQDKAINSLEGQVVDAFRSLFNKDKGSSSDNSRSPWSLNDAIPDSYGGQALPFANELAQLTRGFSKITDEAGDDLRDIFDLTEGRGGGANETRSRGADNDAFSQGARGFLSAAINAVQDHLDDNKGPGGGSGFQLDGLLGVISNTVKDASRNPEEKARLITPEIRDVVGSKLREQHAPLAEQFTRIALDHIKRWLRGNTSPRDLGDGVQGEIKDQVESLVKGIGSFFSDKVSSDEGASRGFGDRDRADNNEGESRGFSKVISDKLSTGLAKVHREVRLEFRKILGSIEKQLFELLPDFVQRPLEKVLGGNPFDSQLDRDAGTQAERGFGDDIKAKLLRKIRDLVRKIQETLRESILGVVNGGHRKFERESWVFVQNIVEQKVQKYLPKVKISVPDDIGNEGVSVGAPTANTQVGGGNQRPNDQYGGGGNAGQTYNPPPQNQGHGYERPSDYQQEHRPQQHQENRYDRPNDYQQEYQPQQHQENRYDRPSEHQQDYRPQQHQENRYDRPNDYQQDYRPQHQENRYDRPNDYQQEYRPQHQENRYDRPNDHEQDYRPQQHQESRYDRPNEYQSHSQYQSDQHRPPQQYHSQPPQQYQSDQYSSGQSQGYGQQYQSGQGQDYQHPQNPPYGQNPRY